MTLHFCLCEWPLCAVLFANLHNRVFSEYDSKQLHFFTVLSLQLKGVKDAEPRVLQ